MKLSRYFVFPLAIGVLSSCTQRQIHLTSADPDQKGEIVIEGSTGTATWSWGPQQFTQKLDVVENQLLNVGLDKNGFLKVKLPDGVMLQFVIEHGAVVCGDTMCHDEHMPSIWYLARK